MLCYCPALEVTWVFRSYPGEKGNSESLLQLQGPMEPVFLVKTTGNLPKLDPACIRSLMRVTRMTFHEQERETGFINHNRQLFISEKEKKTPHMPELHSQILSLLQQQVHYLSALLATSSFPTSFAHSSTTKLCSPSVYPTQDIASLAC